MLRKVAFSLLKKVGKMQQLRKYQKGLSQVTQIKDNDKNIYALIPLCRYQFSSGQSKDPKNNKTQNNQQKKQNQNIQTIQVSIQEFRKMKALLQQLKSQISDLQSQQLQNKKNDPSSSQISKKSRQLDANFSKKLQQFSKQSTVPKQITQNLVNQKDSPLFFKSLQQQLSFQLIKLNSKQQFTELIEHYLKKIDQIQQNGLLKNQGQNLDELVKLSYLIFYRYTSLQNSKIDDQPIKNLLLKIVSHIDILQQPQVQKLLSILNDQIKDRESKWQQQQNSMYKINAVIHQNFRIFVKDIKKALLLDNRVFSFKSKTNKNSEILSLMCHFFETKELLSSSFHPILQKQNNDESSQKKLMIYIPTNLSHLLINILKSGSKNNKNASYFYELFQLSLSINQKNFENQETDVQKFQVQESLKLKNAKQFQRYQYEGVIYFLQNYPQTHHNLFESFFNLLILKDRQIQKFQLIHQLRICLGFLTRPELLKLDKSFDFKVLQEIYRILLSPQTRNSLLQAPKQNGQVFEADENVEFLHLRKVTMILSQIGIQLFKNYRTIVKEKQNVQIPNNLKEITLSIIKSLNHVCNEKVDLKDIFKNEQKQNVSQKLILNLNLFQFIVNLNILSKWCVSLTQDPNDEGLSSQLLTNLVSIFINQTERTLTNQHNSEQQKLKMAEQLVIILLIGRQYGTILKSIQNYFQQSENKQILTNLLQTIIGKNDKHKYFQQYLLLQKQFKF